MHKLTLTALLAALALAAAPTYAADVAAGKKIAESDCADCHGDDDNPAINGWAVDKFTKAMTEYQNGTRTKDAKMAKAAKKLDAAAVANVAAYYATLK